MLLFAHQSVSCRLFQICRASILAANKQCQATVRKPHAYVFMSTLTCAPGLTLHLDSLRIHSPTHLAAGECYEGNVLVHESAKVGKDCLIGPDVSIGDGCVVGDGVRLSNCVIMRGVTIKNHSKVGVASAMVDACNAQHILNHLCK